MNPTTCKHMNFRAEVDVARLTEVEGGPVTGYSASVRISCVECGTPFEFIGLPLGVKSLLVPNRDEARASLDGCEARLPIMPSGQEFDPPEGVN